MKTKNLSRAEAAGFFLAHDNFTILTLLFPTAIPWALPPPCA